MLFITSPWSAASLTPLRTASSSDVLRVACLSLLFVAIFSGRFSFERFVDESARGDWLQLRIWFTALAALGWGVLVHQGSQARRHLGKALGLWLCLFALFYIYLIANILVLGDAQSAPQHVKDILIIGAQAFLVLQLVRSESDLAWFARIAATVAVVLFLFCIAGFGNPDLNGAGWAPFGGPVTFYRIQFLAFCSALYLFARARHRLAYLHLIVAAIGLFSTFASLSKVAFVAGLAVAAYLLFWLLSNRRWKQAILVALTVGFALAAFDALKGAMFVARVNEGLLMSDIAVRDRDWTIRVLKRIQAGEDLRLNDLPAWQQAYVRAILTKPDLDKQPLQSLLHELNRVIIYEDNSGRARLWREAWELFRSKPWFGAGIGNYRQEQIHPYSKQIERYLYPHNILLELAASTGMIGLSAFTLLTFVTFVLLQQKMMPHPPLIYAMGYLLFILVVALAGGDYFDFRVFWLFALIVLAAVASGPPTTVAETGKRP